MFLPISINSVNTTSGLIGEFLNTKCSRFLDSDAGRSYFLCEYSAVKSGENIACDLIIYAADGAVYAHDFLKLKDGNWRNSFGQVAPSLEQLFPLEIVNSKLISVENLPVFKVEE